MLINFQLLETDAKAVTLAQATSECKRENHKRQEVYENKAKAIGWKEVDKLKEQYKRTACIEQVLSVMTEKEWYNLKERYRRHSEEIQPSMFQD